MSVTYEVHEHLATITMDDGKANALTPQLLADLHAAFDRAETDGAGVVLAGRPGRFSAGFDTNVLASREGPDLLRSGFELAHRVLSFPYPVVMACTGHAFAMGVFLLLSADYRVGAVGEFKITANEVAIGLTMPHAALEISRQRLTRAHFERAMILAEVFDPKSAVAAGFLDVAVPPDEVIEVATAKAQAAMGLNLEAHAATKLRARAESLATVRAAIETDVTDFRALTT